MYKSEASIVRIGGTGIKIMDLEKQMFQSRSYYKLYGPGVAGQDSGTDVIFFSKYVFEFVCNTDLNRRKNYF